MGQYQWRGTLGPGPPAIPGPRPAPGAGFFCRRLCENERLSACSNQNVRSHSHNPQRVAPRQSTATAPAGDRQPAALVAIRPVLEPQRRDPYHIARMQTLRRLATPLVDPNLAATQHPVDPAARYTLEFCKKKIIDPLAIIVFINCDQLNAWRRQAIRTHGCPLCAKFDASA